MIAHRVLVAVTAGVMVLGSGCAAQPTEGPGVASGERSPSTTAAGVATPSPQAVAWRHLAMTEGTLETGAAAEAAEDMRSVIRAWRRHGFDGPAPDVDWEHRFVLFVAQADDACPDELIGLDVAGGNLALTWLPPPGGCNLPLIMRLHAVDVHRGHVPPRFSFGLEDPFDDQAAPARIRLAPYDGDAPPPPSPPAAMTDEEVEAVFADHPVRRCTPADEPVPPLPPGTVVDERSEAAEEAQMQAVMQWLRDEGWDLDREVVPIMDRHDNLRPHLRVDADRAPALQRAVDAEFGRGAVVVDPNPYDMAEIAAAQEALAPLMGGSGAGSIWSSTGIPGPVKVGMVDPTREALDRIADTVDPSLVCVEVSRSGVPAAEPS